MSDRAVMLLSDYDSACDKVREKVPRKTIVKNKTFYPTTTDGNVTEIITKGTLKLGESYYVNYNNATMAITSNIYEVRNIEVQGVSTKGIEMLLSHPAGNEYKTKICIYQDEENIMLYASEMFAHEDYPTYITLEEITGEIVSGEFAEKVDDVYEAGQTQGERVMWDNLTNYNTKTDYEKFFSESGYEYITPPYKIYPKYTRSANQTFVEAKRLKKLEADYFDFSQKTKGTGTQTAYYYTFYNCSNLEEIEDIGMQADYGYTTTFANCTKLKKIACVRSDENTLYNGEVFNYCYELEDITFEGVIGQNGLDFKWSKKLTYDSCHSIFTHLKDFREVIADKVAIPSGFNGVAFAEHTLVAGQKYLGTYINPSYGSAQFSGTPQNVEVPTVGQRLAVVFEVVDPLGTAHEVYIYNDNGSLRIFDTYGISIESEISISTITENRTITMPKAVKDNGNATPEDIAEATDRGWTIAWAE